MDYLFARLLLWGEQEGTGPSTSHGPAVSSRVERRASGERLAHLLFRHGEGLYNFQGSGLQGQVPPDWVPR